LLSLSPTLTRTPTRDQQQKTTTEGSGAWSPTTPQNIERYRAGLQRCIEYALRQGFRTVHLLPHVDPAEPSGKTFWRNTAKFDPTKVVGKAGESSSFESAALLPAARALGAAAAAVNLASQGQKLNVEFSLAGEQGLSVFSFPKSYVAMIGTVRNTMTQAAGGPDKASKLLNVEFGCSLNWGKVCGCVFVEEQDPIVYNNTFPDRLARWKKEGGDKKVDLQGVRELLEKIDWLGTSAYASMPADLGTGASGNKTTAPGPAIMEISWSTLAYEMQLMGLPIQDLILNRGKRMIYSEQGVGGCDRKGNVAPDVAWIAKSPYLGLWPAGGGYGAGSSSAPVDPWKRADFAAARRQIYNFFGDYMLAGGGPQYRTDAAYMWEVGTWSVLGVHPVSAPYANAGAENSYADRDIGEKIRRVNAVANSAASSGDKAAAGAAIDRARQPIPGTKASDAAVWGAAARAAAGVPAVAPAAAPAAGVPAAAQNNDNKSAAAPKSAPVNAPATAKSTPAAAANKVAGGGANVAAAAPKDAANAGRAAAPRSAPVAAAAAAAPADAASTEGAEAYATTTFAAPRSRPAETGVRFVYRPPAVTDAGGIKY
jgi:hypothetical protein